MDLTGMIPTLYVAMENASKTLTGFVPAVHRDTAEDRAAVGQTIRVPMAVAGELEDIVPGVAPAETGSTTIDYADVVITHSKAAPITWTGEESKAISSTGIAYNAILAKQVADGMNKLISAVEASIADAVVVGASRATGTSSATPFSTPGDFSDFANSAQILDENGAPITDRQLVVSSAAMNALRGKQTVLNKVNEAGSEDMLRNGMTDLIQGFALRYSPNVKAHVAGNAASYVLDGAAAAGAQNIPVDGGTGSFNAGDVVKVGDEQYVVNRAGSLLTLNKPGLVADVADGSALTFAGSYSVNAAFDRSAVVLVARAPAAPEGGDSASDFQLITDPVTGLTFELRVYRQYRQVKYELALSWGVAVVKPEHVALLIGKK